jgi:hypothetical protein
MKTILFIMLILFFFFEFSKEEPAQMTSQKQEAPKKEITEVVNLIFQSLEKMDVEALFKSYSNSPDFILFTAVGTMVNYQQAKMEHAEWFKTLSSLKVTKIKDEFRLLKDSKVIYSWLGKFEMVLKTGEKLKIDRFGITFIFSKIDNHWKVIYQHSCSSPPIQEKS